MLSVNKALIQGIIAVFSAHLISFLLIRMLPDPTTISFGIYSVQEEVTSAFSQTIMQRSYLDSLKGIFVGDLGRTLDHVSVIKELFVGLSESSFRIISSFIIVIIAGIFGCFLSSKGSRKIEKTSAFFIFLPSFFLPLLFFSIITYFDLHMAKPIGNKSYITMIVLAISLGPAFLIIGQTIKILETNFNSLHAKRHQATGASDIVVKTRLLKNWLYEIVPTLEKVMVLIITGLVFTEPIFSLPGIGTTIVRAVRRSDTELLLGCVLFFAIVINGFRLLSVITRELLSRGES